MINYAFLTDIHCNLVLPIYFEQFCNALKNIPCNGYIISGDISSGPYLEENLEFLAKIVEKPIYFILGNHDHYGVYFLETREITKNLVKRNNNLHYLTDLELIQLNDEACLIGDDGWYDALWKIPKTPFIFLTDWYFIKDFRSLFSFEEKLYLTRELAFQSAINLEKKLKKAIEKYNTIYMVTHIPPWPEKSLFDWFWKPYNSSKILSKKITEIMNNNKNKQLIILSGHTHTKRVEQISDNIQLIVGGADFGSPEVQKIL